MPRSGGGDLAEVTSMRTCIAITLCALMTGTVHGTELTVSFQQGAGGYRGCQDTYLIEGGDTPLGNEPEVLVDCCQGPDAFALKQGLLRFDGILGEGAGQVPLGASIIQATLTLRVTDPGVASASVHRMLLPWYEGDETYSIWPPSGVQPDDVQAKAAPDANIGDVSVPTLVIDVTSSVQAWSDGAANLGWMFLKYGSDDGWSFHSSEAAVVNVRPSLEITYRPCVCPQDLNGDCDVDVVDFLDLLASWGPCKG